MQEKPNTKFANSLIRVLKDERRAKVLSHEKLASKAGISRQAIGKIECGERNPTMLTMYKIAKAMDMTLEDFVRKMNLD